MAKWNYVARVSRLPFELMLALRYLRPKRTYVSAITLFSSLGITLGVAILIIVVCVMSGFDKEWHERILGFNSHVKVTSLKDNNLMDDWAKVVSTVKANEHVRGVSPFIIGKVLLETQPEHGPQQWDAPIVRGIEPSMETSVSTLSNSIIRGHYDVSDNGVLVGSEMALNLNLQVGDRIAVYTPSDLQRMKESQGKKDDGAVLPLPEDYVVKGIFDVGYSEFNTLFLVTSLENAQELYRLNDKVHGLLVKLDQPLQAAAVQKQLEAQLGPDFRVITWMEEYRDLLGAIVVEKNLLSFLLFFIVIVASFCITCSLITFVVQKTHEIGILKSLGASNYQVMSLFLFQSLFVGVLGVGTGFILGFTALAWRNEFLGLMSKVLGFRLLPPSVYQLYELPVLVIPSDMVIIAIGSLVISVAAGVIPSWIAGRLNPVEALRHE